MLIHLLLLSVRITEINKAFARIAFAIYFNDIIIRIMITTYFNSNIRKYLVEYIHGGYTEGRK